MTPTHRKHSFFPAIQITSILIVTLLIPPVSAQNTQSQPQPYKPNIRNIPKAQATQQPTKAGNHNADTPTGRRPSQSSSGGMSTGEKAGIIGGIAAAAVLTTILVHHHQNKPPSKDDLMKNGPKVPENVLMSHLVVDGVIGPNWPVGLDFQLEGPGTVTLDITTEDKVQYHQVLINNLHGRGITITRPPNLPDRLQAATFDIEAQPPAGSNAPPPNLRVFGLAAGPHAVGSIAIDEVKFGPSSVKKKDPAQYGFHSHSDFSSVRADFMWTGLKDQRIVMKQDNETSLHPVAQDEHAQGSFESKGTVGQHYLQIRAWRGTSGDWVVAWSPDIVTLQK